MTYEQLIEYFDYDPLTGYFSWKKTKGSARPGDIPTNKDAKGYPTLIFNRKMYRQHRLAVLFMEGVEPAKGLHVDHVDGDISNNKYSNLRVVTNQENSRNSKLYSNNRSGVTGVYWNKQIRRWVANICVDRKTIGLGSSVCLKEATRMRK